MKTWLSSHHRSILLGAIVFLGITLTGLILSVPEYEAPAQQQSALIRRDVRHDFVVVSLGNTGGPIESHVQGYLVRSSSSGSDATRDGYLSVEGGVALAGIEHAIRVGAFADDLPYLGYYDQDAQQQAGYILLNLTRAHLFSHAHLDHNAGFVISSQADLFASKPLLMTPEVLKDFQSTIFNYLAWPNLADRGASPPVKQYLYVPLVSTDYTHTGAGNISVLSFTITHGEATPPGTPYNSSAHFLRSDLTGAQILFWGDVGADSVQQNLLPRNLPVWRHAADVHRQGLLRAVFIECSYTEPHSDSSLFGHLRPGLVIEELEVLAKLVNPTEPNKALRGLDVFVMHVKGAVNRYGAPKGMYNETNQETVYRQLEERNVLGVRFWMVRAGAAYHV